MSIIFGGVGCWNIYISLPAFNTLDESGYHLITDPFSIPASTIAIALICRLIADEDYRHFIFLLSGQYFVLKGIEIKQWSAGIYYQEGSCCIAVFNFCCAIICTIPIYQQIFHVKDHDLGYNRQDL